MENFSIRLADESDAPQILEFKNLYFHTSNPLELAHPESGHKVSNIDFLLLTIKNNYLFLASEKSSNELVGILIAGLIDSGEAERLKLAADQSSEQKRAGILNCLAYIEHKANACQRFKVEQSLHIHVVCVHPDYRGQKIAKHLFESCLSAAESRELKLMSVDCTNSYTALIAESLGMECISTVSYQEYNEHLGKCLFIATPPHMDIKSFAMRL